MSLEKLNLEGKLSGIPEVSWSEAFEFYKDLLTNPMVAIPALAILSPLLYITVSSAVGGVRGVGKSIDRARHPEKYINNS